MNKAKSKRMAFTLAEVIITIGIIGVVAALIVPNLVQALQEKGMTTSALVFERKLEESLRVMNTADELSGYETTKDFINALSKHMKISKTCDNNNLNKCFKENFVDAEKRMIKLEELKVSRQMAVRDYGTEIIGVMFANGVSAIMAYDKNCEGNPYDNNSPVMSCVSLIYDINGTGKPNRISKDIHAINTNNDLGTLAMINGVRISAIAPASAYGKIDCSNGQSEYCTGGSYANDYWAGAVSFCGGKNNLSTLDDLVKMAQYLYNDENINNSAESTGLTRDSDRNTEFTSLGFPNGDFKVWSPTLAYASTTMSVRTFGQTSTKKENAVKTGSSIYAVCVRH